MKYVFKDVVHVAVVVEIRSPPHTVIVYSTALVINDFSKYGHNFRAECVKPTAAKRSQKTLSGDSRGIARVLIMLAKAV